MNFSEKQILSAQLYLVDCAEQEDDNEDKSITELVHYITDRFMIEYGSYLGSSPTNCMSWLQGLALSIAYYNHDIVDIISIELELHDGLVQSDVMDETNYLYIVDQYWRLLGEALSKLVRRNAIARLVQ